MPKEIIVPDGRTKTAEVEPRRILLVDDEPSVRNTIKMLLKLDGHNVETAENGHEALALLKKNKFDLILTDFAMPAMTGEELATAIKASLPNQPVGMITAYAAMLESSGEPVKNVDFVVSKPFVLGDLRAAVANALLND